MSFTYNYQHVLLIYHQGPQYYYTSSIHYPALTIILHE